MPKRKTEQEPEDEDEEFGRNDAKNDGEEEEDYRDKKPKKDAKVKKDEKSKKAGKKAGGGSDSSNKIELGKNKYVDVREFKGMILIDIREYYESASGEIKPGKKGIALNPEQWKALKESMEDITAKIEELQ